jgi:hypothetical protein
MVSSHPATAGMARSCDALGRLGTASIAGPIQQPGQRFRRDRLADVSVEAGVARRRDIGGASEAGDRDGQNPPELGIAAEPSDEREPVQPRHLEIAQDEIGSNVGEELKRFQAITRALGPDAERPSE